MRPTSDSRSSTSGRCSRRFATPRIIRCRRSTAPAPARAGTRFSTRQRSCSTSGRSSWPRALPRGLACGGSRGRVPASGGSSSGSAFATARSSSRRRAACTRGRSPSSRCSRSLAFAKELPRLARDQREHRWARYAGEEAAGKTVCVVGLGRIGREVARLARALDMHAIGTVREVRGRAAEDLHVERAPADG